MAEQSFSIINNLAVEVVIEDLGLVVLANETVNITNQVFYGELCNSESLKALISAGTVSINNGSLLTITQATDLLTRENKFNVLQNHYTKTEMSSSGQATIHWDNISSAPSFGSPSWLTAVKFRVMEVVPVEPTGTLGSTYVNTSSNKYFTHNGTTWVDSGDCITGDRIIVLNNANQSIFTYDGVAQTLTDDPILDNSGILIDNDGDNKQSQYVYNTTTKVQSKIGDIDFGPHMDGGANKHNATEIRNVSNLSNTTSTIGDSLDTVLTDIDSVIGATISNVSSLDGRVTTTEANITTLQSDVSSLDGRVTTAETNITTLQSNVSSLDGRVTTAETNITTLQSNVSSLQSDISTINSNILTIEGDITGLQTLITQHSADITLLQTGLSTEIQNRIDGDADLQTQIDALNTTVGNITGTLSDVMVIAGRVYGKDVGRAKQLGSSETITFQKTRSASNTYLRIGSVPSNNTGARLYKNMTLVAGAAELSASGTCVMHIRKNNSTTDLATLTISGSTGVTDTSFNLDFNASDVIEIYSTGTGNDPVVRLTFLENGGAI